MGVPEKTRSFNTKMVEFWDDNWGYPHLDLGNPHGLTKIFVGGRALQIRVVCGGDVHHGEAVDQGTSEGSAGDGTRVSR